MRTKKCFGGLSCSLTTIISTNEDEMQTHIILFELDGLHSKKKSKKNYGLEWEETTF